MKTQIIVAMIFLALLMPALASAGSYDAQYKQASDIKLSQVCDTGSSTACSFCNLTVKAPDSTLLVSNVVMTKNINDFTYNLTSDKTTQLGQYFASGVCGDGSTSRSWMYSFFVTPENPGQSNNFVFYTLFGIAIVILILSFIFENYIFSFISGLLLTTSGAYSLMYGFGSYTGDWTRIVGVVIIGMGAIVLIVSALEFLKGMDNSDGGEYFAGGDDDE